IGNAYGAFGSISKERYEVIIEGTGDETAGAKAAWREYEFKAKPGALTRRPRQVAPYHLRIDWLMWFLPFSARVKGNTVRAPGCDRWFLRLVQKLLQGDPPVLALLAHNPFPDRPPRFIRARFYRYRFSTRHERKVSGAYWQRTLIGEYLPA